MSFTAWCTQKNIKMKTSKIDVKKHIINNENFHTYLCSWLGPGNLNMHSHLFLKVMKIVFHKKMPLNIFYPNNIKDENCSNTQGKAIKKIITSMIGAVGKNNNNTTDHFG